jgi:hypothetical protein
VLAASKLDIYQILCLQFELLMMGGKKPPETANSPKLVVAASKLDIYQMLCVQFELLMMGGKPPETCRASTGIKNIV